MLRATTPTHTLNFPEVISTTYSEILVTYAQNKKTILEKKMSEMVIDNKSASVTLTQEETKKFDANVNVEIQVRAKTLAGAVMASSIFTLPVERVLNDEVL